MTHRLTLAVASCLPAQRLWHWFCLLLVCASLGISSGTAAMSAVELQVGVGSVVLEGKYQGLVDPGGQRPQSRQVKIPNIVLNLVQNPYKTNPKQRALTDFLGLLDQFLQFPDHAPVPRASTFDTLRPMILIQAQFAQCFLARSLQSCHACQDVVHGQ